jgi:small conductance mechanosensitive channel
MNIQDVTATAGTIMVAFGFKVLGAIAVWMIGRWLIGLVVRLMSRALTRQHVDPTLLRYLGDIVTVVLNVVLIVALLGYFGVETTSFAALVAGVGIAVGAAWSGLLVYRPRSGLTTTHRHVS